MKPTHDIIILAAGKGTRMRSSIPKVLHKLAGIPMLHHVISSALKTNPHNIIVVTGHEAALVQKNIVATFGDTIKFVYQKEQKGTAHAVLQGISCVTSSTVLILYGDTPLVKAETLNEAVICANSSNIAFLTTNLCNPYGYGRVVRDVHGAVSAIVEEKDADEDIKQITEVNTGIISITTKNLQKFLVQVDSNNAQGEMYLTDFALWAYNKKLHIKAINIHDYMQVQGINDKLQLSLLERYYQKQQAIDLMSSGVTIADPERVDIRGSLVAGRDVFLDINVIIEGNVVLGDNVCVGAGTIIKNSNIANNVIIKPYSIIEDSTIETYADCGPFARLRPGSVLKEKSHVGNFVEIKNTTIDVGVKAGHLAYLGDAFIDSNTNIGAGTIIANYDGSCKYKSKIGKNVFIGSNSTIISPVTIEDNAVIAAGSTIDKDVENGALAIARSKQLNKDGWVINKKNIKKLSAT